LTDDVQMDELLSATDRLVARLAEVPIQTEATAPDIGYPGLIDARARFRAWQESLDHLDEIPDDLLPGSLRARPALPPGLVAPLVDGGDDRLLHWDIRIDNLLRPAVGRVVFVDWGAAAVGPSWVDPLLSRLERVDRPWFDESVGRSPALRAV